MNMIFEWQRLARLGPFRWGAVAPWRAGRVVFGVVVPLALGWVMGHVDYGVYMALGALPAGFVSFQGETRSRVTAVAVASLGMAASTFVGAITAALAPWLLVPVVALWGYVTGLAVSLGQRSSVAVLQWSSALLIAIGLPLSPSEAALRAGLVLAGGLLQAVLVAASWTFRPGASEATALAASYRALAAYAADVAAGKSGPPPPTAFPAGTALADPNPLLPLGVRFLFVNLLEEAERIRASLAAIAVQAGEERAGEIRGLLADAASALDLIARALSTAPAGRAALVHDLGGKLARMTVAATAAWRWAGEALLGQLRAVAHGMANLQAAQAQFVMDGAGPARSLEHAQGGIAAAAATLRANITTTSEAGRHALRLAVIAALAEGIVQATGLYQGRWVTLTIFFVLKPDYSSTIYRGVQRAVGTMLGAGLGGAAAALAHLGQAGLIAMTSLDIAAAYALFDVSYLLFSIFLTAFVVDLLDFLGIPAIATAQARLLDTLIGAALALAAYFAWPTWEGTTARQKFARLVEAHRAYATALLCALAHPGTVGAARLRALQAAARRARSDAEAATARVSDEPAHALLTPGIAQASMAAVTRLAQAELALHALALSPDRYPGGPDRPGGAAARVDALGTALGTAMNRLALAFATLQPPQPIPALRPLHAALRDDPALHDSALAALTDRLVDAVDTLDAILRNQLPVRR